MKTVKGFATAKSTLSRQTPELSLAVSTEVKAGLKKLFGTEDLEQAVRRIIDDVRERGDRALFDLTYRIDGINLDTLEVSWEEVAAAKQKVSEELVSALKLAADRIASFHRAQKKNIWHELKETDYGQLIRPLERVGLYVPGGTASYPSTVLMTAVPARVAGVKELILVTPPAADGQIPSATLVAADIAEVDRIFSVGGAQAIAALAYGTASVPGVDKICGPGNIFVTTAKRLVYGMVAIDGLQGPSEILIIADETANPACCAADMLAQAEHDSLASAILITTSPSFADDVILQIERQLPALGRQNIARRALDDNGMVVVVDSLAETIELANLYAPEHLSLMLADADSYVEKIINAGCIIIGADSTVVLGDYVAGPSHVLPTGGTARFASPLNVVDFIKFINTINLAESKLKELGKVASAIARTEGLDAHSKAIEKRLGLD